MKDRFNILLGFCISSVFALLIGAVNVWPAAMMKYYISRLEFGNIEEVKEVFEYLSRRGEAGRRAIGEYSRKQNDFKWGEARGGFRIKVEKADAVLVKSELTREDVRPGFSTSVQYGGGGRNEDLLLIDYYSYEVVSCFGESPLKYPCLERMGGAFHVYIISKIKVYDVVQEIRHCMYYSDYQYFGDYRELDEGIYRFRVCAVLQFEGQAGISSEKIYSNWIYFAVMDG